MGCSHLNEEDRMRPSEKYYENFGGDRVVPENRLEEDVVRQAILADQWDLVESEREALPASVDFHFFLCRAGGRATYWPEWSPDFVAHYQVGRHRDDGFFDLTIRTLSTKTGEATGSVELFAALKLREHPPFQTGWSGPEREHHFIPFWYFAAARAHPQGIRLKVNSDLHGALLVPGDRRIDGEWHCSPPHVSLFDI
jgi:hypothetical protein